MATTSTSTTLITTLSSEGREMAAAFPGSANKRIDLKTKKVEKPKSGTVKVGQYRGRQANSQAAYEGSIPFTRSKFSARPLVMNERLSL
jgi:hypothetical protein